MVDNSKNENFDQLRNLLNEVEITPSENLWSKIEAGLDNPTTKPPFGFFWFGVHIILLSYLTLFSNPFHVNPVIYQSIDTNNNIVFSQDVKNKSNGFYFKNDTLVRSNSNKETLLNTYFATANSKSNFVHTKQTKNNTPFAISKNSLNLTTSSNLQNKNSIGQETNTFLNKNVNTFDTNYILRNQLKHTKQGANLISETSNLNLKENTTTFLKNKKIKTDSVNYSTKNSREKQPLAQTKNTENLTKNVLELNPNYKNSSLDSNYLLTYSKSKRKSSRGNKEKKSDNLIAFTKTKLDSRFLKTDSSKKMNEINETKIASHRALEENILITSKINLRKNKLKTPESNFSHQLENSIEMKNNFNSTSNSDSGIQNNLSIIDENNKKILNQDEKKSLSLLSLRSKDVKLFPELTRKNDFEEILFRKTRNQTLENKRKINKSYELVASVNYYYNSTYTPESNMLLHRTNKWGVQANYYLSRHFGIGLGFLSSSISLSSVLVEKKSENTRFVTYNEVLINNVSSIQKRDSIVKKVKEVATYTTLSQQVFCIPVQLLIKNNLSKRFALENRIGVAMLFSKNSEINLSAPLAFSYQHTINLIYKISPKWNFIIGPEYSIYFSDIIPSKSGWMPIGVQTGIRLNVR